MNPAILRSISISRRALVAGAGALSISTANASDAPRNTAPQTATPPGTGQTTGPESWLSGLALQAATYAAPTVAMYNLRDTTSVGPRAKVPVNEIWRISDISNPAIAAQTG